MWQTKNPTVQCQIFEQIRRDEVIGGEDMMLLKIEL